jgi:hypothetical protein
MSIRIYIFIWVIILCFLSSEYLALNGYGSASVLRMLQAKHVIGFDVSADPGRSLSLWLGWIGLSLMLVMNVYSLRKRADFLKGVGRLGEWLNFHVFCGLTGPTFILFHCNFKVRGLVAISFWSMVVSFSSGVIGRYFYLQIVQAKSDFTRDSDKWLNRLKRYLKQQSVNWQDSFDPYLDNALELAGASGPRTGGLKDLGHAMLGDLRLHFVRLDIPDEWPAPSEFALKEYALNKRRALTLEGFQRLMGYWHAFHFPFAIFMYGAAAIHVTASMIFAH